MRWVDFRRMLAVGVLAAVEPADAQTTEADSWRFALTAYGYLPAISGTAYFPVPGTSRTFSLNQSELINNLKMTFMGAFDAHHGHWGFFADVECAPALAEHAALSDGICDRTLHV